MEYLAIFIILFTVYFQQASVVFSGASDFGSTQACCNDIRPTAREKYTPEKIYTFEKFKLSFKKEYPSMMENLFRKRLYLSRSFRAFVSSAKYKLGRLEYYFGINHLSDWSQKELSEIMPKQEPIGIFGSEASAMKIANEKVRMKREVEENRLSNEHTLFVVPEILDDGYNVAYDDDQQVSNEFSDDLGKSNRATSLGANSKRSSPYYDWNARQDAKSMKQNPLSPIFQKTFALLSRLGSLKRYLSRDMIEIDHRNSNCFPQAKYQGRCGSCFAFTAISLYEWHYCKATGHKQEFSEQYVIDCGNKTGINGCNGGAFFDVSRFVREFGIELSSNFPNTNLRDQTCPYTNFASPNSMGYLRPKDNGFFSIPLKDIKEFLRQTPIGMYLHTNKDIFEYRGGVHDAKGCSPEYGVHAMLLVGYGRESGQPYYLFRNSFSTNWGQNGYYKLNRKSVECIHVSFGAALDVEFKPSLLSNINPDYDGVPVQLRKEQLDNDYVFNQTTDSNSRRE